MFAAKWRLRKSRDFKHVYARGRSCVHPMLVLYVRSTPDASCRIGFSISKKLGGAVERNRLKRRLREACRPYLKRLKPGHDLIFVGRTRLAQAEWSELQAVVMELLHKSRLLPARSPAETAGADASSVE